MTTYSKLLTRQFKTDYSRFISILLIILVGITILTGLSSTSLNMYDSMNIEYEKQQLSDFQIINPTGFADEDIATILSRNERFSRVIKVKQLIVPADNKNYKLMIFDFAEFGLSPLLSNEVLLDDHFHSNLDKVTLFEDQEFSIKGTYANPLYNMKHDIVELKQSNLSLIFYLDSATLDVPFLDYVPINNLYLYLNDSYNKFSKKYEKDTVKFKQDLESLNSNYIVLSLFENDSYMTFKKSSDSIGVISGFLPVIFFVIILIVILSTMSKMIDKERTNIGIMKTLGFRNRSIVNKYLLYVFVPSIIGGVAGTLIGFRTFPMMIWQAYKGMFNLPPLSYGFYYLIPVGCFLGLVGIIVFSTFVTVSNLIKEQPSKLLRSKSPKPGRRIILEYIPFLWKKMSFKYKSMFKNIFRYSKNTILTIFGIATSTSLLVLAIGLKKSIDIMFNRTNWFYFAFSGQESIIYFIVLVLIIFGAALDIVIIFSLVNIMIEERKQEISTLRVLGYRRSEVVLYLYREEAILVVLGVIGGFFLGYFLIKVIVDMMIANGTPLVLSNSPLIYLFSFIAIGVMSLVSFAAMVPKINSVSMTESLKAAE